MATMYKDDELDEVNNITMKGLTIVEDPVDYVQGNNGHFAIGNLSTLLLWNNAIRVDYLEMQHNISVYTNTDNPDGVAQGNRNPYVDFPNLVDYVYGNKKSVAGTWKNLVPASSYLECEEETVSHYAIKEAKRDYSYGEQIAANDYKIVEVKKNYTYSQVTEGITNSLSGYTFVESDGDYKTAKITTPINEIEYQISLNPLGKTSTGEIFLSTAGIDKSSPGVEQEVTFGDYDFLLTYTSNASTPITINNITSPGGITFGSGTKPVTGVTIKTKESYTIDAAFIKAFRSNKDSSYQLTIKVGDSVLLETTTVNNADAAIFGKQINEPLTGQLSYIFTGSNALKINSIAFNAIIA